MDKKVLYGIGIGAAVVIGYHLLKKPATAKFDASTETTDKISKEIIADANVEKVQREIPRFGVPRNMMQVKKSGVFANSSYTSFANAAGFKNYVDVKHNSFFKPQLGVFQK
jgi:hypothetical protein